MQIFPDLTETADPDQTDKLAMCDEVQRNTMTSYW